MELQPTSSSSSSSSQGSRHARGARNDVMLTVTSAER